MRKLSIVENAVVTPPLIIMPNLMMATWWIDAEDNAVAKPIGSSVALRFPVVCMPSSTLTSFAIPPAQSLST